MAWTRHGHHIPGTPREGEWKGHVMKCGGPRICVSCMDDASKATGK